MKGTRLKGSIRIDIKIFSKYLFPGLLNRGRNGKGITVIKTMQYYETKIN
jgi:hypothetical protein